MTHDSYQVFFTNGFIAHVDSNNTVDAVQIAKKLYQRQHEGQPNGVIRDVYNVTQGHYEPYEE